jgi:hypothetical protein
VLCVQKCSRHPVFAEALCNYHSVSERLQLDFRAGDIIEVTYCADRDWWWGRLRRDEGWFPSRLVKVIIIIIITTGTRTIMFF